MRLHRRFPALLAGVLTAAAPAAAGAADSGWGWLEPESGKLLATAGVSQLEGAGGGGLVPWALITGYGTSDAAGGDVHGTYVRLASFTLGSVGAAVGIADRLELSYAHEWFDTGRTGARLGLGAGFTFQQEVAGAKLRLAGDAVFDQDGLLPQIAAGVQLKADDQHAVLKAVGATASSGADVYLAATKLLLRESLLLDLTLRETRANQFGLLGFGGDRRDGYTLQAEGSGAVLISRHLAAGAEYRTRPDDLRFARESDAYDVFGAWFLSKNASVTLAYVDLGQVARQSGQHGLYLSVQTGF